LQYVNARFKLKNSISTDIEIASKTF
jgi:hypothetical protein